jgi:hypothetical protein
MQRILNRKYAPLFIQGFFATILIALLGFGCAGHIRPKPDYAWPEMATNKIPGKLAIYIPPNQAKMIIKADPSAPCCPHKNLLIGKGASELTKEACLAIFNEAIIFDKKPTEEYLKNKGFRGLLTLDSIKVTLNMPTITGQGDSAIVSDLSLRLGIDYQAKDLLIKQDSLGTFGPDGQVGKKMTPADLKQTNTIIENITNRALKESGTYLAQSLANIFGAR